MILIADSGSFKTDWILLDESKVIHFSTIGMNPYFIEYQKVKKEFDKHFPKTYNKNNIKKIFFYGAGCGADDQKQKLSELLLKYYTNTDIFIDTDLLGAARGIFKNKKGIIGIIGTGTFAGVYDGSKIINKTNSLGYILGDEGSGAWLGKKLAQNYLHGLLPAELSDKFKEKYNISNQELISNIYSNPYPNKYLANFTTFYQEHINNEFIHNIIYQGFDKFINLYLKPLVKENELPIYLTGSIVFLFKDIFFEVAKKHQIIVNDIIKSPMEGLIDYHKNIRYLRSISSSR